MPEERKLVSVLFADVVGSTAFGSDNDPEVVRSVMSRYYERMKAIAETHGGLVEKFIGDAVMVVFGVPRVHDDDAERAVRAAMAMRDAMPALNADLGVDLRARIGVNTGEAVAGTGEERQFLVTGDAVNVGARLQQGAEAGEVIVGALTERLTRQAIEYAAREAVRAKGKVEPIQAFAALRPRSAVPEQARGLPQLRAQLVGRQRELRLVLDTFTRVREERRAHLFTLVGAAGVGKSRLVGEVLARIGAAQGARVLRGRCLPYGQGITYWPFIEMLREDGGLPAGADRATTLARLEARIEELFPAERDRRSLVPRAAVLFGLESPENALPDVPADRVAPELAFAMRRYVEAVARQGPTVVVVDDLQWGEAPLVAAVEQIADRVREAPLFLLCIARPELLETRQDWSSGKPNATTITLDPLSVDETRTLIARLLDVDDLPERLRREVVQRSEGNPLFCEEFLRMLIDDRRIVRDGERWRATGTAVDVRVPESIQALLAARLDLLAPDERRVVHVASVIGERFDLRQVRDLDPGVDEARFETLARKGFLVEDAEAADASAMRFKHLLIRDAAYASLPKSDRAELHERFGIELERASGDRRGEVAEILAHHAERAFSIAAELRAPRDLLRPRAERALDWSLRLADRASARGDLPTLSRATEVASRALAALEAPQADPRRAHVAVLRVQLLFNAGRYAELAAAVEGTVRDALAADRPDLAARARLWHVQAMVYSFDWSQLAEFERGVAEAIALFERAGDPSGTIDVELARLEIFWASGRLTPLLEAGEQLLRRAMAQGDDRRATRVAARLISAAWLAGRRDEADRYLVLAEELVARSDAAPPPWLVHTRARRPWLHGDTEGALANFREVITLAEEWGYVQMGIGAQRNIAELALEIGRLDQADAALQAALAASERSGERWNRVELHAMACLVAVGRGDLEGAERALADSRANLIAEDVSAVAEFEGAAGQLAAARGRAREAEAHLRRAVELLGATEFRLPLAGAKLDLAEFLASHGQGPEATALLDETERGFAVARLPILRAQRERVRERVRTAGTTPERSRPSP